jgi:two-component system CheB/CheR fusion protein
MPSKNSPAHLDSIDFPVVGIGASAGGLEAFQRLLRSITPNSGMAYIVVQHLAPAHESQLPEILARETDIPVFEITDAINLAPDNIYIIPENKILTAYDGKLKLEAREKGKHLNMAIDLFFNSLAEVHKGFARGVLLSGTGYDGTLGLKTIKENGGATFVQNPESAAFDAMPLSAIRAGAADFILEVEEIPAQLMQLDNAYEASHAYADEDGTVPKTDEDIFKQILRLLRLRTGNDFTHYKQPTLRRRIARRMVISKLHSPASYLSHLREDKKEQDALFNDILIPVSYFFRESNIFNTLADNVFPLILNKKGSDQPIRLWVAGCSTGEEAYSLAICLHEFLADKQPDTKVQIFASDISENVIAKARAAIYTRQEVQNVTDQRLERYFTKTEGVYRINKEIRDMCVFATHNFVKDPPFAKIDLISCRNVLIYLDPFLQKKALNTFHYALKPQGILFLGKSETAGNLPNLFSPLVKNHKIFLRKDTTDHFIPMALERVETAVPDRQQMQRKKVIIEPDFQKLANDILFSKYTPAGVIINDSKEIVHFHGDTGPFLLPPPGKPNFNIYKMLREGMAFELKNALLKVKNTHTTVLKENIPLKGVEYLVNIEVVPLEDSSSETHYLILFHKNTLPIDDRQRVSQRKTADQERIKQLEAEIEQMREDIRRVTEDQEAANEELQSANEELLSNSEELQTLNEELETSAEELQSNNEELITVNDELMDRQEQLSMARQYSEAIVETIREPLVVLTRDMRIKSANASFYKYFKTTEQESEGRVIYDIGSGQWNLEDFKIQMARVLPEKLKLDDIEVTITLPDLGERTMLLNIRPIVNENLSEQLILLAIEDITDVRQANILLLQNNRELEENNKELTSFSYVASHDLQEPLRKIHTFGKLIMDNESNTLSETSLTYLDRMMVSTRRMQQLIDDLLRYSHISKADDEDLQETDVALVIDEVISDLSESIDAMNAKINVGTLPTLKTLPLLASQLFINLITNAIKYSRQDVPPVISISYTIANGAEVAVLGGDTSLTYCKIKVTDNGIGFDQAQANRIFEPFQRLHGRDKYEGTGIGLAICKKIMLKHKGFINAESKPGTGTTFNLYFPF